MSDIRSSFTNSSEKNVETIKGTGPSNAVAPDVGSVTTDQQKVVANNKSEAEDSNNKHNSAKLNNIDASRKSQNYIPTRTSSAPPEEHASEDQHKKHFQPTKTNQSLQLNENSKQSPQTKPLVATSSPTVQSPYTPTLTSGNPSDPNFKEENFEPLPPVAFTDSKDKVSPDGDSPGRYKNNNYNTLDINNSRHRSDSFDKRNNRDPNRDNKYNNKYNNQQNYPNPNYPNNRSNNRNNNQNQQQQQQQQQQWVNNYPDNFQNRGGNIMYGNIGMMGHPNPGMLVSPDPRFPHMIPSMTPQQQQYMMAMNNPQNRYPQQIYMPQNVSTVPIGQIPIGINQYGVGLTTDQQQQLKKNMNQQTQMGPQHMQPIQIQSHINMENPQMGMNMMQAQYTNLAPPGQYPQYAQIQPGQPYMTNQGIVYNNRIPLQMPMGQQMQMMPTGYMQQAQVPGGQFIPPQNLPGKSSPTTTNNYPNDSNVDPTKVVPVDDKNIVKVKKPLVYKTKDGNNLDINTLGNQNKNSNNQQITESVPEPDNKITDNDSKDTIKVQETSEEPVKDNSSLNNDEVTSKLQDVKIDEVIVENKIEEEKPNDELENKVEQAVVDIEVSEPTVPTDIQSFSGSNNNNNNVLSEDVETTVINVEIVDNTTVKEEVVITNEESVTSTIENKTEPMQTTNVNNNDSVNINPQSSSLPVTISASSKPKSDESADWRSKPAPSPVVVPVVNKNKKTFKKGIYAAADAASDSDMLSAYTDSQPTSSYVIEPPVELVELIPEPEVVIEEELLPDSWDEIEQNAPLKLPIVEPVAARSLRPGGKAGTTNVKLNLGHAIVKYNKDTLKTFAPFPTDKSLDKSQNPLSMYAGTITINGFDGNPIPGNPSKVGVQGGLYNIQHGSAAPLTTGHSTSYSNQNSSSQQWSKQPVQQAKDMPIHRSDSREVAQEQGWKRDVSLPPAQIKAAPPIVPVVRQILIAKSADPIESIGVEATSILNKITPQTFNKLSEQILTLNITNTAMLDKLITTIFEKAIQEPNFTNIYAELCLHLNTKGVNWNFYTIVKSFDSNEYFWIKDFTFEPLAAGPYKSQKECLDEISAAEVLPVLKFPVTTFKTMEVILLKNLIMKIYFCEATNLYYSTVVSFDEVEQDKRSDSIDPDLDKVIKHAKNNNNFRSRLLCNCQKEFTLSTQNESKYGEYDEARKTLKKNKSQLKESEYAQQEADIDEAQMKLKRRMLGNIRFVGELYKTGIISTGIMHECITDLLGTEDNWKAIKDDQFVELLCRLITTIGQVLELKSNTKQTALFEAYFRRIHFLSKDKSLNSRMRFSLEEVIALRKNKWQARREQEGPLKISEIHQRIQEEELNKQSMNTSRPGMPYSSGGRGGGNQQQQQLQHGKTSIYSSKNVTGIQTNPNNNKFGRTVSIGPGYNDGASVGDVSVLRRTTSEFNNNNNNNNNSRPPQSGVGRFEYDFSNDTIIRRVRGLINEFLKDEDLTEIRASYSETHMSYGGYVIIQIIKKITDSPNPSQQSKLFFLLEQDFIRSINKNVVESSLRSLEELKMLVDTTMDVKFAPEAIATAVRKLVKLQLIPMQRINAMIDEFIKFNLDDEINPRELVLEIFGRFSKKVSEEN